MSPPPLSRAEMKRQAAQRHNARYEASKHKKEMESLLDYVSELCGTVVRTKKKSRFNTHAAVAMMLAQAADPSLTRSFGDRDE